MPADASTSRWPPGHPTSFTPGDLMRAYSMRTAASRMAVRRHQSGGRSGRNATRCSSRRPRSHVDLLEEAKDLLAHAVPDRSLEEVHLRAMRALVAQLKTRKYARTNTRAESHPLATPSPSSDAHSPGARAGARQDPRRRGRYIPAAVRRAVWERDGGRCTYVGANGQRCRERACLEFDHIDPYARGGPPAVSNLRLACRSHNGLAAEQVFGRDFIERKKSPP